MRLTKTSMLLAVLVVIGMLLCGVAGAAPAPVDPSGEVWLLEVYFAGKGYLADTDNDTEPAAYIEDKHKLETKLMYAMYERDDRQLRFAYYSEFDQAWQTWTINDVYETESKVLAIVQGSNRTFYEDSSQTETNGLGTLVIQYKKKEGEPATGKLKSLGMSYQETYDKDPSPGQTEHIGVMKMKGKIVPQSEVPADVRTAFGLTS